jgi:hypothetical protein
MTGYQMTGYEMTEDEIAADKKCGKSLGLLTGDRKRDVTRIVSLLIMLNFK